MHESDFFKKSPTKTKLGLLVQTGESIRTENYSSIIHDALHFSPSQSAHCSRSTPQIKVYTSLNALNAPRESYIPYGKKSLSRTSCTKDDLKGILFLATTKDELSWIQNMLEKIEGHHPVFIITPQELAATVKQHFNDRIVSLTYPEDGYDQEIIEAVAKIQLIMRITEQLNKKPECLSSPTFKK